MIVKKQRRRRNKRFAQTLEEVGAGLFTAPLEGGSKCRWMYVVPPNGTHLKALLSV